MHVLKFILRYTVGIIRDPHVRRTAMFYLVLIAMLLVFTGSTILDAFLQSHIYAFASFWILCAWFTIAAVLLACYDMIAIRAAARRTRRHLEKEYLRRQPEPPDDENAP